jgi:V-type H+-transporting ATPase subunit E
VQALYTIMEKDIKISGRKKDSKLLEVAAKDAVAEFEKEAGFSLKYAVDEELSESSCVSLPPLSISSS